MAGVDGATRRHDGASSQRRAIEAAVPYLTDVAIEAFDAGVSFSRIRDRRGTCVRTGQGASTHRRASE
jgi:hypothetical protein